MPSTQRRSVRLRAFAGRLGKFGTVGLVGFAVNITVFNLLRTTVFDPGAVDAGPIYAKVVPTTLAIIVNWVGVRFWTFGANRQSRTLREAAEFFAVSLIGMGIGLPPRSLPALGVLPEASRCGSLRRGAGPGGLAGSPVRGFVRTRRLFLPA